jgi:hypothetical protein
MTSAAWRRFKRWTKFHTNPLVAGSMCIGSRFVDNGTTATDRLTELVWEKKTNDASVHDASNSYAWEATYQNFLVYLNPSPDRAWSMDVTDASIYNSALKGFSDHVRAVRGGF